jgi:phospholipid/cholesterol/gamma-HCH transport system substrate-binding protein
MEIRARYFLIGVFVLAVVAAVVGFVYWLYNTGGLVERATYQVRFDGSVSGLSPGSEVLFNGIVVGEVARLQLNADSPGSVIATIAIDKRTPVRADTRVGLTFGGLTGTATVALTGGAPSAPPLTGVDGQPPLLVADSAALKDLTQSGRDVLTHLDQILSENADSLKSAIANIDTFAGALARNSDKVDSILEGLQRLTGGGPARGENIIYDLTAPASFPPIDKLPTGQLTIPQPTAVVALDTQRIVLQEAGGEVPVFENVRWADSLPLLVQARVIEAFENAGYLRLGTDVGPVSGDFQLLLDLRRFRINAALQAEVAYMAKIVDRDGNVIDARLWEASQPVATSDDAAVAAAGLDAAFGRATADMVAWTLQAMAAGEAGAGGEGSPSPADGGGPAEPLAHAPEPAGAASGQ